MRLRRPVLLALLILVFGSPARAQSGYQGYPVSPRGLGMGGAVTALADGSSALYYNPAGLAFGQHSSVQVSGSLYGITGATLDRAIGGGAADLRYMNFQAIPANLSFEIHGLRLGRLKLSPRWGLGLSVLAPYSFKFAAVAEDRSHGTLVLRSAQDLTYSVYLGFAYRIRERLSFGLAIVFVYRQYDEMFNVNRDNGALLVSTSGELNTMTIGHTLAFGLRYSPREHLWLGLGLHLPLQHLFSVASTSRERYAVFQQTAPGQYVGASAAQSRTVDARFVIPLRLNVGLAWEVSRRWAIAGGLYFWMPHDYNSVLDRDSHQALAVNRHAFTVNASLGAEVWLRQGRTPLRFGAFTDRSPLERPTVDSGLGDKVDLYGATLSIGFQHSIFESEVGVLGAAGPVRGIGVDIVGGSFDHTELTGTRWQVLASYATTLRR